MHLWRQGVGSQRIRARLSRRVASLASLPILPILTLACASPPITTATRDADIAPAVASSPSTTLATTPTPPTTSKRSTTTAPATSAAPVPHVNRDGVSFDGVDPMTLGMTKEEVTRVSGIGIRPSQGCGANPTRLSGAPDGFDLTLDAQSRARSFVITSSSFSTTDGARVGMGVDEVTRMYAGRLVDKPAKPGGSDRRLVDYNADHSRALFMLVDVSGMVYKMFVVHDREDLWLDEC